MEDKRGKHKNHRKGSNHHRWNHDKIKHQDGYIKVRVGKEHPLSDPNGYAYEHLLIWISAGKEIADDEVLHHINGDRKDNRLENLERMSRSEHNNLHNKDKLRDNLGRFTNKRITRSDER